MASQDSPNNEKTYRFISDPGHKENLSGRVRAACVTCRRKKIKCSGNIPCDTCEDKGIVCEGLTDRKRPRRSSEQHQAQSDAFQSRQLSFSASQGTAEAQSVSHSPVKGTPESMSRRKNSATRPTAALHKLSALSSHDSGYSSSLQSGLHDKSPHIPHLDTAFSFSSSHALHSGSDCVSPTEISPSATDSTGWHFDRRNSSVNYGKTETARSDTSQVTLLQTASTASSRPGGPHPRDLTACWQNDQPLRPAATDLIHAAKALEEQAQTLRRLASQHKENIGDDLQRETIVSPIGFATDLQQQSAQAPSTYNNLSLLFADRHSGTGVTPLADDYGCWWDIDPAPYPAVGFQESSVTTHPSADMSTLPATYGATDNWRYQPDQRMASTDALSDADSIRPPPLIGPGVGQSQLRHGQRLQPPNSYDHLYSWPE